MDECRFELTKQPCLECGKPSGQLGTCRDFCLCPTCRQNYIELEGDEKEAAKTLIRLAEDAPYADGLFEDEGEE